MIGLTYVVLPEEHASDDVSSAVCFLKVHTPEGRYGAVAWRIPHVWRATNEVEGALVTGLLGDAQRRTEDRSTEEWLLHSNLFVRAYDRAGTAPRSTWQVTLLRRRGMAPYRRPDSDMARPVSPSILTASAIDVRNPAFTRDVANNVWHFEGDRIERKIAARLYRLTCWSDEEVLALQSGKAPSTLRLARLGLAMDYIPTAVKQPYGWERPGPGGQVTLFAEDE